MVTNHVTLTVSHRTENESTKYFQITGQTRLAFFSVNDVTVKVKVKFILEEVHEGPKGRINIALLLL